MLVRQLTLMFAVLVLTSVVRSQEPERLTVILQAFEQRDGLFISRLHIREMEALPLEARNQVALAAARSLSIKEYLDRVRDTPSGLDLTIPGNEDSPEKAEYRRQWGINRSAAGILRDLSEKRLINDPRVLPLLIDALEHPERAVAGPCYQALEDLTRHPCDDKHWTRGEWDQARHARIVTWWREWWKQNKDRHPVFDLDLEERARSQVLRLSQIVEREIKPQYAELNMFRTPELPLRWQTPIFFIDYNPQMWSLTIGQFPTSVRTRMLPRILISCRFQSTELNAVPSGTELDRMTPDNLKDKVEMCFARELPGTDVILEVKAAAHRPELIEDLKVILEREMSEKNPPSEAPIAK